MASFSAALSAPLMAAYEFASFRRIADIGGGTGRLVADLLTAHGNARGVLFDLPNVVMGALAVLAASGVEARCDVVGGSFFDGLPSGADAYILRAILHDWDDAASLAILAACRRVFRPEGRLLIMERIVGGPNDGLETKTSDLNMLVSPDGQERTADEFAALLANAGFRMERIIEVTPRLSIVEAAPI